MTTHTLLTEAQPRGRGFRQAVRTATRDDHDRSEAGFAPFLNDPKRHLPAFLAAQRGALAALNDACSGDDLPEMTGMIPALIDRLDADCAAHDVTPPTLRSSPTLSPLAVGYLVYGSNLGLAVIRKRAEAAGIAPMPRFFAHEDRRAGWQSICARLDAIDPDSDEAITLTNETRAGYALFAQAAEVAFRGVAA
jgi:heme oxygenase